MTSQGCSSDSERCTCRCVELSPIVCSMFNSDLELDRTIAGQDGLMYIHRYRAVGGAIERRRPISHSLAPICELYDSQTSTHLLFLLTI